jgi:uncharacterized protein YbjQ (UPF0145 family)
MVGVLAAAGPMMQFAEKTVKETQSKVEAQQQAQLKAQMKVFDEREKAATTEEEKKAIQQERDAAVANQPVSVKVDMSAATDVLKDPTIMGFSYLQMVTGIILSVILLISGIGLIRLLPWGRSLAVAWAGLQIVQIVLLTGISLAYVQPIQAANQEKMLAKMEADAKAPGAPPVMAESIKLNRAMSSSGATAIMAVGTAVVGMIYPVIVLILLSRPGARAALQGPKPDGPPEF